MKWELEAGLICVFSSKNLFVFLFAKHFVKVVFMRLES